jgi:hypothetical protein
MAGQYDNLIGELTPGQQGWLPLDESGTPSGPATIQPPPGPNAKACSVKASTAEEIAQGWDALLTSTGAPITDHNTSNVDRRFPNDPANPPPPLVPSITTLTPSTGPAGIDLALVIAGTNLTGATAVNAGGTPATLGTVSGTAVEATVPAASMVEGTLQVSVTTPSGTSNELPLTVAATVTRDTSRRK